MFQSHRTQAGVAPASVRCDEDQHPLTMVSTSTSVRKLPTGLVPVVFMNAVVLVLAGVALVLNAGAPAVLGALPAPGARSSVSAEIDPEAPPPRAVTIERLGIQSTLVGLKVKGDGELEVPDDYDVAGWHRAGTAPGDVGPAVVVGHVDSFEGPAVFYRLRELQPGDRVTIERVDGSTVVFEVYGQETVAKDAFPTERVYGATDGPELRLLTCGGAFDEKERSYTDNVVVYARQVAEPEVSDA